ncbi:helix-turn-helix domain-containing protein [Ethanoligenens sp.]|uniref:helix-turn-helix domain-containing protein n=1 Tax=Ethanoligenens sp. TaxID=2099655 RepID=UPI0039E8816B
MDESLLNVDGAMEFLGVSEKTLIKLLREEHLPARKIGREWRFSKQALTEWLAKGDSIAYAANNAVYSFSKDLKGNYREMLDAVGKDLALLRDAESIDCIPDLKDMIPVPDEVTMRVTYKQVREVEKLRFEIFWPQRDTCRKQ